MTLQEKIGQLCLISPSAENGMSASGNITERLKTGKAGGIYSLGEPKAVNRLLTIADSTRLKIPFLSALDIIHGYKTVFPCPLGLSCTWNPELIEKTARISAIEATAAGYNWTFSPMVDLTRDPRWGRVVEGSGEDPYLGSLIAAAMVRGYQQNGLLACVKHFALYGASEAGRDYNITDMSRLTMFQNYLPPYKAAVDAGALSFMSSFNEIDGMPSTGNHWLLTDILRKQWGFKGFVISDANAISELVTHGIAEDELQVAQIAFTAGVDMDLSSETLQNAIERLLKDGKISMKQIDGAVRRILEVKYRMDLFNYSYRDFDEKHVAKVTLTPENKAAAKEAALKSIVLLKNEGALLPLKKDAKIALIGPFADKRREMFSSWTLRGDASKIVTFLNGIKNVNSNTVYAEGSLVTSDSLYLKTKKFNAAKQQALIDEAVKVAAGAEIIVLTLGEDAAMSGEAKSKTDLSIPQCQRDLLKALKVTGKPIVLLLVHGRPMTIEQDLPYADAVLATWRLGTMAGDAVADVLFGDYNPSGKLTMSFPRNVGQIPLYYNHKNTGRPRKTSASGFSAAFTSHYIDSENSPLYPFGYGLNYTDFQYGEITLSNTNLKGEKSILIATVSVKNTGKYAGEETIQLYLNDPVASVTRPVKELKKFQKVFLQVGEIKNVTFTITPEELKFYNQDLKWDWESGKFNIYIGTDSENVKTTEFVWNK